MSNKHLARGILMLGFIMLSIVLIERNAPIIAIFISGILTGYCIYRLLFSK